MRFVGSWVVVVVVIVIVFASLAEPAHAETVAAPAEAAPAEAAPAPARLTRTVPASPRAARSAQDLTPVVPIALAVNAPWAWRHDSIGGSIYAGVTPHWAVRANFAKYDAEESLPAQLLGSGPYHHGGIFDLGLGGVWYPRRLWDGFTIEAGALMRHRDFRVTPDDLSSRPDLAIRSETFAARAMVGWSWLVARVVCLSVGVGASAGLEHGKETVLPEKGMPTVRQVDRMQVDFETYARFGFAFGR
jgi:hypothetical protein